jgi:hypothetical protein
MGISSSTSKVKPIYESQITGASNTLTGAYNSAAPKIQGVTDQITGLIPSLLERAQGGDPSLNAAQGYITSTLGGSGGNPYLDQMIAQAGNDTAQTLQANAGTRGLTGGTAIQQIMARELSRNALGARSDDYDQAQQRKAQAASMAAGVSAGQSGLYGPVFDAAQAVTMPLQAAGNYAQGIGGLLGQYTNTKTSQPWGGALLGGIASGLGSFVGAGGKFSDRRLKTDITRVGQTDSGLAVYTYRYGGEGPFHMGVMAQEVEVTQPEALGPVVEGYMTVNYEGVR